MHEHWTDRLSDYLDDELTYAERQAVTEHLAGCPNCARTLDELRRVVGEAASVPATPPSTDLWNGIAARLQPASPIRLTPRPAREPRRISFTMPQLAAAAMLVAALSGALVLMAGRSRRQLPVVARTADGQPRPADTAYTPAIDVATVSFADAQYDQAVADLEGALKQGRGRLDPSTVAALEQSLQTIDQAIAQARQALAADPANGYLTSHLFETRRRKLDLLRRAAALTETN